MFHKINILSTKVLSHFYAVCFGKAGFCKHCHVNRLDLLVESFGAKFGQVSPIDRRARKKSKLLKHGLVFKEFFVW